MSERTSMANGGLSLGIAIAALVIAIVAIFI